MHVAGKVQLPLTVQYKATFLAPALGRPALVWLLSDKQRAQELTVQSREHAWVLCLVAKRVGLQNASAAQRRYSEVRLGKLQMYPNSKFRRHAKILRKSTDRPFTTGRLFTKCCSAQRKSASRAAEAAPRRLRGAEWRCFAEEIAESASMRGFCSEIIVAPDPPDISSDELPLSTPT